jgi:hypothetical protein
MRKNHSAVVGLSTADAEFISERQRRGNVALLAARSSNRSIMAEPVQETGYYFNRELPYLALIAKGVRPPFGRWLRIADDYLPPEKVQELIAGVVAVPPYKVPFVALLTEFDLREFEQAAQSEHRTRSGSGR